MTAESGNVAKLLDRAETDLNGVARSMLAADPLLMQQSQVVLEHLVESLRCVKSAAAKSGMLWPSGIRVRLQAFQGKLRRLEILSDTVMSTVTRSQRPALSTGGYTARGAERARPEVSTLTLDC